MVESEPILSVVEVAMAPPSKSRKIITASHAGDSGLESCDGKSERLFISSSPAIQKHGKVNPCQKSEPMRQPRMEEHINSEKIAKRQQSCKVVSAGNDKKKTTKETSDYCFEFTRMIQKDQEALMKKMKNLSNAEAINDTEFLVAFRKLYEPMAEVSRQEEREGRIPKALFSTRYREGQKMQEVALHLVSKFEEVGSSVLGIQNSTSATKERWDYERKRMQWLVSTGRSIGERRIESILTATKSASMDTCDQEAGHWLFEGGNDDADGWGMIAKKHVNAYERLVKKISTD